MSARADRTHEELGSAVLEQPERETERHEIARLALQRTVGNAAVAQLLAERSSRCLTAAEHEAARSHAGAMPPGARIHEGPAAARAARELGASAFTLGGEIFLGAAAQAPEAGRRVVAHELVHVAQQRGAGALLPRTGTRGDSFERGADRGAPGGAGGSVPALQLLTEDAEAEQRRRENLDTMHTGMIQDLYRSPERISTDLLLRYGWTLNQGFLDPTGPRTERATAQVLVSIYRELKTRESNAPRDQDGALLRDSFGESVPWHESRPASVEQVRPFSPANLLEWSIAASGEMTGGPETGKQKVPDPPFLDRDPTMITAHAKGAELTTGELLTEKQGGGPEISGGLATLKQVRVGQLSGAIAQALAIKRQGRGESQPAKATEEKGENPTLFDTAGEVWFVANRLHRLDRTGHIVSTEFAYSLKALNLKPGVYFWSAFDFKDPQYEDVSNGVFKVDGPVEIVPPPMLSTGTIREMLDLAVAAKGFESSKRGFALIVSETLRTAEGGSVGVTDLDVDKLIQAVRLSRRHIEWAVMQELHDYVKNPGQKIVDTVMGFATGWLAKAIPGVGQVLAMYDAMQLAAWLGTTASIAGHAKGVDEIDIAAQAIAKKVASWGVEKAKSGVEEVGKAAAGKVVKKVKGGAAGGVQPPHEEGAPSKKKSAAAEDPAAAKKAAAPEEESAATKKTAPEPESAAKKAAVEEPPETKKAPVEEGPETKKAPVEPKPEAKPSVEEPPAVKKAPVEEGSAAKKPELKAAEEKPPPKAAVTPAETGKKKQERKQPPPELQKAAADLQAEEAAAVPKKPRPEETKTPKDEATFEKGRTEAAGEQAKAKLEAYRAMSDADLAAHVKKNPNDFLAQHALKEKRGEAPEDLLGADKSPPAPTKGERSQLPAFIPLSKKPPEVGKSDVALLKTQLAKADALVKKALGAKATVPETVLEAPWVGQVKAGKKEYGTSAGLLRYAKGFWSAFHSHPDFKEDSALLKGGNKVTKEYAAKYGWPDSVIGDTLEHHHLENGAFVIPWPQSWHTGAGLYGFMHLEAEKH